MLGNYMVLLYYWHTCNSMLEHIVHTARYIFLFLYTELNKLIAQCLLVYAFYGRSRPLLWFLSFCFILNEVAVVIIQAMAIPKYKIIPNSLPPPLPRLFGSCIFERHSGITAFVW